jgi:protein-tyrosine phosphatase
MIRVLFVCTGNICRSPSGEGVLQHMLEQAGLAGEVEVDSCGLGGWHVGEGPDERSQAQAARRGYDLSQQKARQVHSSDFATFDRIIAMDKGHLRQLRAAQPATSKSDIRLMLDYAGQPGTDVPDPYYGGPEGFEAALDMIEAGCRGLLDEIRADLGCKPDRKG